MKAASLYETDFYAWTRDQAARLRQSRPNSVDWELLAEEVEDLGRSQFNAVLSHLRNLLAHLLMAAHSTDDGLIRHWRSEMVGFHSDAIDAFTNAMRQRLEPELPKVWDRARRQAAGHLAEPVPEFPAQCPFSLEELLDEGFDMERAAERIRSGGGNA